MDYLNPVAAEILARAPHSASGGLDDQVYNRLLRERIINAKGFVKTPINSIGIMKNFIGTGTPGIQKM